MIRPPQRRLSHILGSSLKSAHGIVMHPRHRLKVADPCKLLADAAGQICICCSASCRDDLARRAQSSHSRMSADSRYRRPAQDAHQLFRRAGERRRHPHHLLDALPHLRSVAGFMPDKAVRPRSCSPDCRSPSRDLLASPQESARAAWFRCHTPQRFQMRPLRTSTKTMMSSSPMPPPP